MPNLPVHRGIARLVKENKHSVEDLLICFQMHPTPHTPHTTHAPRIKLQTRPVAQHVSRHMRISKTTARVPDFRTFISFIAASYCAFFTRGASSPWNFVQRMFTSFLSTAARAMGAGIMRRVSHSPRAKEGLTFRDVGHGCDRHEVVFRH